MTSMERLLGALIGSAKALCTSLPHLGAAITDLLEDAESAPWQEGAGQAHGLCGGSG